MAAQAATSRALTPERIAIFVNLVRQKIETADILARKAYLQAVALERWSTRCLISHVGMPESERQPHRQSPT